MSPNEARVRDATPTYVESSQVRELPSGFKQTEIGMIPQNWDVVELVQVARLESGHTPSRSRSTYWSGTVPWVSLHDTESLDQATITSTAQTITEAGLANSSARLLPEGTVVFSRTATVGKATTLGCPMATSQDFANFICGSRLHNRYLVYLFRSMGRVWQRLMAGSIHNTIYMPDFSSLKIALPPLREQLAITEALSDIDGLIETLDALIAKKCDIKKAAMLQLLSGRNRLPGFNGEWETKRLGDHVIFLRSGTNSRADLTEEGPIKYLHYGDIHRTNKVRLSPVVDQFPSLPAERAGSLDRLRDGDLVFVDVSEDTDGIGKSVEISKALGHNVVSGLHTIAARFDKSIVVDGYKALLQFCPSFRSHLRRLAAGTKVYATNRSHIASAEIKLPPPLEQQAIARVLHEMDEEVSALSLRRSKTCAIKQGMMQQLLTGRVRVITMSGDVEARCASEKS